LTKHPFPVLLGGPFIDRIDHDQVTGQTPPQLKSMDLEVAGLKAGVLERIETLEECQ
jgi:hypothetical protein